MHLLSSSRIFAASLIILSWSSSVLAAATVSINTSGDKSYSVQGSGMSGVAGLQLNIKYDSTSLNTPTVTQGGLVAGAMLAANTSNPGSISIAIISTRPFSDSGQIATISFASKTGSGGIISANVNMINSQQAVVPASISVAGGSDSSVAGLPNTAAGLPFSQPSETNPVKSTQTSQSSTSATTNPTYPGTITLPADLQQQSDTQTATTPATAPIYTAAQAAARSTEQAQLSEKPATEMKSEETPQYIVYKGISDRFKLYKGRKKLSDVVALFDKKVAQNIKQEPAVLLSDGKVKATLTVDIPVRISSSPNFAVNGGKLVSFKQDKAVKGRWIVEVLPEAGAVKTIMTIIAGVEEFEYPLTVAPPMKTKLTLDESGWNRFLKDAGTTKIPLHDLNNDGVRDYMDEYIFVANYLAGIKSAPAKPTAVKDPKKK